jgi:HK97 family phage prohead protease
MTKAEREKTVREAIQSMARADASYDIARRHTIAEADKAGIPGLVPDNWREDGTLKETKSVWVTVEQRDTANDVFTALEGAIADAYPDPEPDRYYYSSWYVWVQDWMGGGKEDNPYTVIFHMCGDLYSAPFEYDDENKIVLGEAVKVRPVTEYVERQKGAKDIEWRKAHAPAKGRPERRSVPITDTALEVRSDDDGTDVLVLTGIASVTGVPYPVGFYTETIERGAFKRSLNKDDLDVQLLVNHTGLPLARTTSGTLKLRETDKGLFVEAELDPEDPDVRALEPKMRRGDVTEMSFAFRSIDEDWNDDYSNRSIKSLDIHRGDVSVVSYGASPTTTATIRSEQATAILESLGGEAVFGGFVQRAEMRAGEPLSAATMEALTEALNALAREDDGERRAVLAEMLGATAPEPDPDPEPEDRGAERKVIPLPDYTKRARLQLVALGGGR